MYWYCMRSRAWWLGFEAGQAPRAGRPRDFSCLLPANRHAHAKCDMLEEKTCRESCRRCCYKPTRLPEERRYVLLAMPSLQRKVGAQKDLAELCYISALHQTGDDVRKDGSIRDVDVALYLRSRHNVLVSEEEVRKFILPGLAGTTTCCMGNGGVRAEGQDEGDAIDGGKKSNANDDSVVDLAELTALLMIPVLVKLAEEQQQQATAAAVEDDFIDDDSSGQCDMSKESSNANIIENALRIILNDVGNSKGKEVENDPANGLYPELTPDLLRTILITYGEEEMAADDRLIEEMTTMALVDGKVLDPATFAHILTADLAPLCSSDETRVSTNYQDAIAATIDDQKIVEKKGEDVESGTDGATFTTSTAHDLKRFRFNTSSIDFTGGRYASKAMVALLWASFIMFVFAELIIGGDLSAYVVSYYMFVKNNPCQFIAFTDSIGNPPGTYNHTFPDGSTYSDWVEPCEDYEETFGMKIGKSVAVWLYRFIIYMVYGVIFVGLGSLGNSTESVLCCNRRVAAMAGTIFLIVVAVLPFTFRMLGWKACPDCYSDDAAFRFIAYSYIFFAFFVILIQSMIVTGLNKLPKLRKVIDSEVYAETGMKQAAIYKTTQMIEHGLALHGCTDNGNNTAIEAHDNGGQSSTSSLAGALLNYFTDESTESIGGFFWCWRNYLNGNLFYEEGITLSGRILAMNIIQGCLVVYLFIGGVLLTRGFVYLWGLGKDQIDGMVDFLMKRFNLSVLAENVTKQIDTSDLCADLSDPTVCETIKDYVSGDAIQAFVSSIAYGVYPTDAYMISIPFVILTMVSVGTALVLFSLYIPSVCRAILEFRCGNDALFNNNKRFKMYRTRLDMTTQLLGTIFWTGIIGPIIIGILVMLPVFFLLWQTTRPLVLSIIAVVLGISISVLIRDIVAIAMMKPSCRGFYRKNVNRNNIGALALEAVMIGLGIFYAFTRVAKILVVTLLYISRVDTNLLSVDLNVGPLQDHYPKYFRQQLLLHESHKHPWLEVLGKLYLMKFRHRENFISSAGYSYRLIFTLSLLPYLRKYRLQNRETDDNKEEVSRAMKLAFGSGMSPRMPKKRATDITAIDVEGSMQSIEG